MLFKLFDRCNLIKIVMKINCIVIMNIYEFDVLLVIIFFDRVVLNMYRLKVNDNLKSFGLF